MNGRTQTSLGRACSWIALGAALAAVSGGSAIAGGIDISEDCIEISTYEELRAIEDAPTGEDVDYCLVNDLDLRDVDDFVPLFKDDAFSGSFDGRGHVIRNLRINAVVGPTEYGTNVGLFYEMDVAAIRDLRLEDVEVNVTGDDAGPIVRIGTLIGDANYTRIENCSATGSVRVEITGLDDDDLVRTGGLVGSTNNGKLIRVRTNVSVNANTGTTGGIVGRNGAKVIYASSSAGAVVGGHQTGGLAGWSFDPIVASYATGPVAGRRAPAGGQPILRGGIGGLVGLGTSFTGTPGSVVKSFATGEVRALDDAVNLGGLIGNLVDNWTEGALKYIRNSFALGPVRGMSGGFAGGLMGRASVKVSRVYAAGAVSVGGDAEVGGVTGFKNHKSFRAYWDTETTDQAESGSPMEVPRTTNQLQNALPEGFNPDKWGITPDVSYPYLLSPRIDFAGPLAAVVRQDRVYIFVPIAQRENVEYEERPDHPNQASRAVVHTMVARAIGFAEDVEELKDAKVDDFWDDDAQDTSWSGEVTNYAELGELTELNSNIGEGNIIGLIRERKVVALRGLHGPEGDREPHWMLATSFTVNGNGTLKELVANDPRTGKQVRIDPETRRVVSPEGFPLEDFRVADYQPITITPDP